MNAELREFVRHRAGRRCEYCHAFEAHSLLGFEVDHIIAEKHSGPTIESNLAWACSFCNSFKGPNLAGWLPDIDLIVRLFHPRRDHWPENFLWQDARLIGKTPEGRATILVLDINRPLAVETRRWYLRLGQALD